MLQKQPKQNGVSKKLPIYFTVFQNSALNLQTSQVACR